MPDLPLDVATRARRAYRRARSFVGNAEVRLTGNLHRRGRVPSLLSVVVPVYNVEAYLDECLRSLRFQEYRRVEILVVDDGSSDGSLEIALRHKRRDLRIRVIRRPNGGLSAARNTGVAAARGEFLAFLDSDDIVTPTGYRVAVEHLLDTGSDFAVFQYQRLVRSLIAPAATWIRKAHASTRVRTNLDEFPDILVNSMACSKVFRRSYWDDSGLGFVEGIIWEDQQVTAEAYARASSFDVLAEIGYTWRIRTDKSSITQGKRSVATLRAQFASANESIQVLRALSTTAVTEARVVQLLRNDLPQFTSKVVEAEEGFWELLREELPALIDELQPETYERLVPAQNKVLNHLIVAGEREAAEEFLRSGGLAVANHPVRRDEVGLVAELPFWRDPDLAVPDRLFLLADQQTSLRSNVRMIRRLSASVLEVHGWAYIENVDLAGGAPVTRAWLCCDGRSDVELEVTPRFDAAVDETSASEFCDYRNGGVAVRIDAGELSSGQWRLHVEVSASGETREGAWGNAWPGGNALRPHPVTAQGKRAGVVAFHRGDGLTVDVFPGQAPVVVDEQIDDESLHLLCSGDAPSSMVLSRTNGSESVSAELGSVTTAQTWTATVRLPPAEVGSRRRRNRGRRWRLLADVGGEVQAVRYAPEQGERQTGVETPAGRTYGSGVNKSGEYRLTEWRAVVWITHVRVLPDGAELTLTAKGLEPSNLDAAFVANRGPVDASVLPGEGSTFSVRMPFRHTRWGIENQVVESGPYTLRLTDRTTGERTIPLLFPGMEDALPIDELADDLRILVRMRSAPERTLVLLVRPPLLATERGPRNQRMFHDLANRGTGTEHSVFLRSLYGESANDSALALHEELRRRGSERTFYWSVQDRSVQVPEGGVAVVEGSEEWHRALGEAGHVVVNIHQPAWYRKPSAQVMVQTLHGYPYKGMGQSWWARTDLSVSRVSSYLDRARDWNFLVSPSHYATEHLLREFFRPADAKRVQLVEAGYPRNDVLLSPDGVRIREDTRLRLGVAEDQVAVLYAPTFRDEMSKDGMRAKPVDYLDLAAAAQELGPGYVLLMRGHAFHARSDGPLTTGLERVVDVTHYPDIADLCLASDAAVLDYSSLRFDYALTRKPMVFLVPDKRLYHRLRPAILPYDRTAPGPHVRTTDEVVQQLRDLAGLRTSYGAEVERFLAAYVELDDGHAASRVVDAVFGTGPGSA